MTVKPTNLLIAIFLLLFFPVKIKSAEFNMMMKPDISEKNRATWRSGGYYSCKDGRRWPDMVRDADLMFMHHKVTKPEIIISQHVLLKPKQIKIPKYDDSKTFLMIQEKLLTSNIKSEKIENYYYSGMIRNSEMKSNKSNSSSGTPTYKISFRNMVYGVPGDKTISLILGDYRLEKLTDSKGVSWNIEHHSMGDDNIVYCPSNFKGEWMILKTLMPITVKEKIGGPELPRGKITTQYFLVSDYLIKPETPQRLEQPSF